MTDYIKPTHNYKPDCIIIHCGTNDLRIEEEPKSISKRIMDLSISSKRDENTICTSGIVPRNDNVILKEKAANVNEVLHKLCYSRNMCFISHDNINPTSDLNRSKLNPNKRGLSIMVRNILEGISKRKLTRYRIGK